MGDCKINKEASKEFSEMKLAIIGSGVVGQATGVGLAIIGNEVVFHE